MNIFRKCYWWLYSKEESGSEKESTLAKSLEACIQVIGNEAMICYNCGYCCEGKRDWYTHNYRHSSNFSKRDEFKIWRLYAFRDHTRKNYMRLYNPKEDSFEDLIPISLKSIELTKPGFCSDCFFKLQGQITMIEPKSLEGSISLTTESESGKLTCHKEV